MQAFEDPFGGYIPPFFSLIIKITELQIYPVHYELTRH